jgi:acetoin:2,6-dichlorophenolindophenol oxidoreductase subunit beta
MYIMKNKKRNPGSIRALTFGQAINEALIQAMEQDSRVFLMGCGVTSPTAIFGSVKGILERFSSDRVIETPVAENGIAGIALGAALMGMKPVISHQRIDFCLLAMDQIVNHAAKWHYMSGGTMHAPMVIRGIIGRRWGQGAQHSQSLQSLFGHIPGLKVVMPSNAYDAKGLLVASIKDGNPVIYIEHRLLYNTASSVPAELYTVPLGTAKVVREGADATIVAVSFMVLEALRAAARLKKQYNIDVEIIDLRSIRPIDKGSIIDSVVKTGRLLIADTGWKSYGVSAEVAAIVAEHCPQVLKSPVVRIGLPAAPTPTSVALENTYYPAVDDIVGATARLFSAARMKKRSYRTGSPDFNEDATFIGPY